MKRKRSTPFGMSGNPNYSPTTCLAHLILCGTSGWALKTAGHTPWATGTFTFLLGHGLIGILRFGHPNVPIPIRKLYEQCSLLAEVLPLPLLNVDLFLQYGLQRETAYLHAVTAFIPTITQFMAGEHNKKVVDLIVMGNVASLLFISVKFESAWVAGIATLTTLNHFLFRRLSQRFDVPKMDMVAIGLSFFNIFAVNCLKEVKDV